MPLVRLRDLEARRDVTRESINKGQSVGPRNKQVQTVCSLLERMRKDQSGNWRPVVKVMKSAAIIRNFNLFFKANISVEIPEA